MRPTSRVGTADAIGLKERAFAAYRRRGDPLAAAELARRTAFLHGTVHGNMAAASGWMARAERMLAEVDECAAHGWLTLDRAPFTRDSSERERLATAALAIGRRFGDADLEFDALALLGLVHVTSGRVAGGMRLLDEAMAAVSGGEVVGGSAIADIFCRLLGACEHAVDVTRAEQWMAATGRLVPAGWSDFVAPTCRCHYGGILIAIGRWAQAEHELLTALHAFDGGYRAERSSPLLRLAELRTRQGRFDEAERLVQGFEWHPTARRMLAEIALARGDHVLAQDLARLCIEGQDPLDTACAPLLELVIDVQLARGDVVGARETLHPTHPPRHDIRERARPGALRSRHRPGARGGGRFESILSAGDRAGEVLGPGAPARGREGPPCARSRAGGTRRGGGDRRGTARAGRLRAPGRVARRRRGGGPAPRARGRGTDAPTAAGTADPP